jgi:GNAT superfamily N-acetyltransferase
MYALAAGTSAAARREFGIGFTRLGGGIAVSVLRDSSRFWNKAIGLGVTEPVDAELVAELIAFNRSQGNTQTVIQIAPGNLPPDWEALCERFGIQGGSVWAKLVCRPSAFSAGHTALSVQPLEDDQAPRAAEILAEGFGMSPGLVSSLYVPAFRTGRYQGFAAWQADAIVAMGALCVSGPTASMYGAATLPEHRRLGAQSALLAARAEAAAAAGCEWLIAETGVPQVPGGNPSLNNMCRVGFEVLYERTNWIWRDGA